MRRSTAVTTSTARSSTTPSPIPADVVGQWNGLFPLLDAGPAIELALDWIGGAETAAAATPLDPATLTAFAHHFMTLSPDTTVVNTVRDRLRQFRERLTELPDRFRWTADLGFAATTTPGTLTEIGNEFSALIGRSVAEFMRLQNLINTADDAFRKAVKVDWQSEARDLYVKRLKEAKELTDALSEALRTVSTTLATYSEAVTTAKSHYKSGKVTEKNCPR